MDLEGSSERKEPRQQDKSLPGYQLVPVLTAGRFTGPRAYTVNRGLCHVPVTHVPPALAESFVAHDETCWQPGHAESHFIKDFLPSFQILRMWKMSGDVKEDE